MSKKDFECTIEFLPDKPAKEDEFGPHDRIATAIAKVIDEQPEAGKAISLLGSWGSGKSSIIELLEIKLNKKKKSEDAVHENSVFLFDAWTHQNDSLRLSFLEAIIAYLKEIGWTNYEDWSEKLEKLKIKEEETHAQENFFISGWESAFIVSIFLFPLGLSLLNKYVDLTFLIANLRLDSVSDIFSSFQAIISFISIAIIIFPLVILFAAYIYGENVLSVLLSKIRVKRDSITLRSPEPTSLQFQTFFSDLMECTLTGKRRLTIVLDNLDRIGKIEALSLWSTMRMFFEFPTKDKPKWIGSFWLMVPMDNNAASRLWPQSETVESQPIAKAFVDKTFQIFFRVSPPVPTDWKRFFMKNLNKAIKHDKEKQELLDDFDDVYRLFQLKLALEEEILTPRAIKLFINKLATVHSQCCGEDIPMISQALFVLYNEKIDNIIDNISDFDFFGERIWELYVKENEAVTTGFVSLYLNVKKDDALQILVEPRIDASFENAEPTAIRDIISQHWFLDTCDRIITSKSNKWSWDKIVNAGYVINKVVSNREFGSAFLQLTNSLLKTHQINVIDDKKAEGFSIILHRSGNKRQALEKNTIESIASMVFKAEDNDQQPDIATLEKWVKGVIIILGDISDNDMITDSFKVPGKTAKTYLSILEILNNQGDKGKELAKYFLPKNIGDTEVFNELELIAKTGALSEKELDYTEMILNEPVFDNWSWNRLVESLFSIFQAPRNKRLEPGEIIAGLSLLNRLEKKGYLVGPNNESRFAGLAKDGHIFWHLKNLVKNKGSDFKYGLKSIGATLVPIIKYAAERNMIEPEMREYWQEGYDRFKTIIETFEKNTDNLETLEYFSDFFLDFYDFSELIEKMNNIPSPIIKVSFEYIYQKENKLDYYTPELLIRIYKSDTSNNFKRLFKEDSKRGLILSLVENTDLINILTNSTDFSADLVELYILVLETNKGSNDLNYRSFLVDSLSSRPNDEWIALFTVGTETAKNLIDLLLILLGKDIRLDPSSNLFIALEDYVNSILSGGLTLDESQIERNKRIPEALQVSDRNTFARNLSESIRDKVKAEGNFSIETLINLYGDTLLCQVVFEDDNSEFIRTSFKHIINRQSLVEVNWLEKAVDFLLAKRVKRNIRDALTNFMGQVRNRLSEESIDTGFTGKLESIYQKLERKYGKSKSGE